METVTQILQKNLESKELDCKLNTCPVCKEPTQKRIELLGRIRTVNINCRCKREENERKEQREKALEKQQRLKQIVNNSLMDKKFRQCRFENWDFEKGTKKMYKLGTKYAAEFNRMKKESIGLLIYGEPGNGKTHCCSCIANELIGNMVPVVCVSINALLERIKETYNTWGKEGEDTVLKSLSNADLLIIDDLGTEQDTDWSRTRIYNILDSRYRNGLPLIVTTNMKLTDLKEKYHIRTYDRLLEMCTPVLNEWKSIRVEKAIEKTKILKEILS